MLVAPETKEGIIMWTLRRKAKGPMGKRNVARKRPARRPAVVELEQRIALTVLPAGFVEDTLAGGLTQPTSMALAPDGRIFVTEQTGSVRVIKNG
jgi:glucose/arabinose dehydrogenase